MLNRKEIAYYSRQLLLDRYGVEVQEKFKSAKVLVVGAGGLGCPVLQYIAAAGIGTIGIVDGDVVDESNLHRQTIYSIESVGLKKVDEAKKFLQKLNPYIQVNAIPENLTLDNAEEIVSGYDLLVDCSDNYETRYLVNDTSVYFDIPLVYGAIYRFEGQLGVFNYDGGPTYRCLFPEKPGVASDINCATAGVIGVLPGTIGIMQANEIIKIISGVGKPLSGKIQIFNALTNEFTNFELNRAENIDYRKYFEKRFENRRFYRKESCSTNIIDFTDDIDEKEFLNFIQDSEIILLDVRERHEQPVFTHKGVIQIPISELEGKIGLIPTNNKVLVFCRSGKRSRIAVNNLKAEYKFDNLYNLKEGISIKTIEQWKKLKK